MLLPEVSEQVPITTFVVYETTTGRVDGIIRCPEDQVETILASNNPEGKFSIFKTDVEIPKDRRTFRIDITKDPMEIVMLEALPIEVSKTTVTADGVDEAVVSGVPEGLSVLIDGTSYTSDGAPLELSFSVPGTYLISVNQWPWMPWKQEITAE